MLRIILRRHKLVALAVVVGIGLYLGFTLSANATPLPARAYGPSSTRFTVAFGAQPEFSDLVVWHLLLEHGAEVRSLRSVARVEYL